MIEKHRRGYSTENEEHHKDNREDCDVRHPILLQPLFHHRPRLHERYVRFDEFDDHFVANRSNFTPGERVTARRPFRRHDVRPILKLESDPARWFLRTTRLD